MTWVAKYYNDKRILNYKQIIQDYLKSHKTSRDYSFDIEWNLKNCYTNAEVYQKLKVLEYRATINNCKLRGFDNYIPNREYEFLLGDIIKELDKIENKKDNRYENKKNQIQG